MGEALRDGQRTVLHKILAPYAHGFARIGLFGSRATGAARPESDIDLVIYGADDPTLVDRLFTAFHESLLSVRVDVVDYDRIEHLRLREDIDRTVRILFERRDFVADSETA